MASWVYIVRPYLTITSSPDPVFLAMSGSPGACRLSPEQGEYGDRPVTFTLSHMEWGNTSGAKLRLGQEGKG